MDEVHQETQKPDEKHFPGVMIFVSILVAIYFLCPVLYIYPVFLVYRKSPAPKSVDAALTVIFYPVEKLAEAFPAYGKMLEWEADELGL